MPTARSADRPRDGSERRAGYRRQGPIIAMVIAAGALGAAGQYELNLAGRPQAGPGLDASSPAPSAQSPGSPAGSSAGSPNPSAQSPGSPAGSSAGSPNPSANPSGRLPAPTRRIPPVPVAGSGRFVPATGGGAASAGDLVGTGGRLIRYHVQVELVGPGPAVPPDSFAAAVERTIADRRGWTAGGAWSFQSAAAGDADLLIHLATPATTDRICGQYGLATEGEVSCRGGRDVVINLKRWLLAVPWYADAVEEYRHMVVNHEVGHFLGHDHTGCPGPGRPAPVMQTQTISLDGCFRNPWPYPDGRTYVGWLSG